MTIDTSREAVERLLDGVTPGPWEWAENHPLNACANVTAEAISGWTIDIATLYGCSDGVPNPSAPDEPWGDHPIRRANARFIAASRDLVPALLAERDAALAEVAHLTALLRAEYERGKAEAQVQGDTFYILEWMAGARPPVHPNPMRGRQSFRTPKEAIAFFKRRASDAQFLSLTKRVFLTEDCTPQALALLTQEGR